MKFGPGFVLAGVLVFLAFHMMLGILLALIGGVVWVVEALARAPEITDDQ